MVSGTRGSRRLLGAGRGLFCVAAPVGAVGALRCADPAHVRPERGRLPRARFQSPSHPGFSPSVQPSASTPPLLSPPLLATPLQSDPVESPLSRSLPSLELPPTYLSRKSSPRSLPHLNLFVPYPGSQLCQDIGNCEFRILYNNKKVVPSVCRVCACLRPSLSIHRSSSPGELKDSPL